MPARASKAPCHRMRVNCEKVLQKQWFHNGYMYKHLLEHWVVVVVVVVVSFISNRTQQ